MSFASEIKKALCTKEYEKQCCIEAQLSALLAFGAGALKNKIRIKTENVYVAEHIFNLLRLVLGDECFFRYDEARSPRGSHTITIEDSEVCRLLLQKTHTHTDAVSIIPDKSVYKKSCCKSAFLCGAFLGAGSMSDPKKNYHIEYVTRNAPLADMLYELLLDSGISAKMTVRKNSFVVYVKDSEAIAELLGIMGAGVSMMEFYNIKIERELRNNINRVMNCDTANIDKTTAAARRHINAIKKVEKHIGFDKLPPTLAEIAELRVQNPELSLKELGELLNPTIGKSGVNHRLERICEMAENLE